MKRLDHVISSFGFKIVESIADKQRLFVGDSSIVFNVQGEKEFDMFISAGYSRYLKIGRVISKIQRNENRLLVPCLDIVIDNPRLFNQEYWWDK